MALPRSIERIVEDQAARGLGRAPHTRRLPHRTAIALSRLPGAGGEHVAQRLAEELHYDLFDRELIERVASSAQVSQGAVSGLDERDRAFLTEWLDTLIEQHHFSPQDFRYHLTLVVGALARRGGAVIVGRGSHLILAGGEALRVLVAAPLEARVAAVAAREGIDAREARRVVLEEEVRRRAFLRQHFRAELDDPCAFDLVVNPHALGVGVAVESIKAALAALAAGQRGR